MILCPDDVVLHVMESWKNWETKFLGKHCSSMKFVLRTTHTLSPELRENIIENDVVSRDLLFFEAEDGFLGGRYVLPDDEMVALASLLLQLNIGDWKTFSDYESELKVILPTYFLLSHHSSSFLLDQLNAAHNKHVGTSEVECKLKFLSIISSYPFYGSTFFRATNHVKNIKTALWQQEQDGTDLIAINHCGIHFLDYGKQVWASYFFDQIVEFSVFDGNFFSVEVEGNDVRNSLLVYKTKLAPLVVAYLNDIHEFKKKKKKKKKKSTLR
eukprot:TRINITY_DN3185_c0_g1_i28.p1 TRINITY_DN3185_c0_g1~~TRINITY_DN3185_c0_g1_i28.p1  ORF type:complete len:270 (+),score=75.79 TRINITY_DN3185_c0_g1_i28:613-1422(+)